MKKVVTVLLSILIIWGAIKVIGRGCSIKSLPVTKETKLRLSIEKNIIGGSYLNTASDIHWDQWKHIEWRPFLGQTIVLQTYWVVAKMPEEDFYRLVEGLELTEKPDLLKFLPKAFDWGHGSEVDKQHYFYKFWDVTPTVDENTYFGEKPEEQVYFEGEKKAYKKSEKIVAKYEMSNLYFKKLIRYVSLEDENQTGQIKNK